LQPLEALATILNALTVVAVGSNHALQRAHAERFAGQCVARKMQASLIEMSHRPRASLSAQGCVGVGDDPTQREGFEIGSAGCDNNPNSAALKA